MEIQGHNLTALGVFAGVGSPLVGARNLGYEILGNVETRSPYYITEDDGVNTFEYNFKVPMTKTLPDNLPSDITLMAGHPKCGAYSNLVSNSGEDRQELRKRKSDALITTLQLVAQVKPLFFFMDNLPKFLGANHISMFYDALPDYDIWPTWVSNAGYGNCQWHRNRLFIIASRSELNYRFIPNEFEHKRTLKDVIQDLNGTATPYAKDNHVEHTLNGSCKGGYRLLHDGPMNWEEAREYFRNKKDRRSMHYFQEHTGVVKHHFGYIKCRWEGPCNTLTGITPKIHPKICLPLSPRERARVMGFPDDFIFKGIKYEPDGTWRHHQNISLMRQTGNCIPCEFPTFLAEQIIEFLKKPKKYYKKYTGNEILKPNPIIEDAKHWASNFMEHRKILN